MASLEIRLVYSGPLKAATSSNRRTPEKHQIRKIFHWQLKTAWQVFPELKRRTRDHSILAPGSRTINEQGQEVHTLPAALPRKSLCDTLGNKFQKAGFKFVPLVNKDLKLSCGLDILFLRRDMPGSPLIHSGGDIDNRLKVLFDALRIPAEPDELRDVEKDPEEDPYFFCLLEDDALISEVTVTTDRLLIPSEEGKENDVHLIIKAKIRPTDFSFENLFFVT